MKTNRTISILLAVLLLCAAIVPGFALDTTPAHAEDECAEYDTLPDLTESKNEVDPEEPAHDVTLIEIADDDGNAYQFLIPSDIAAANAGTVQFIRTGRYVAFPTAWQNAGAGRQTGFFQIRIGDNLYPAFCLQPRVPGPQSGTYAYTVLNQNTLLARTLYYVFGAPGQQYYLDTITVPLSNTSVTGSRRGDSLFVLSHITLALLYGDPYWANGVNATGRAAATAFRDWVQNAPYPPSAEKSFCDPNMQATINIEGARQETPWVTLHADPRNAITIDPRNFGTDVVLHRDRDGEITLHWSDVEIRGGDQLQLRAPLNIAPETHDSGELRGTQTRHWYAIIFNQSASNTQTMGGHTWHADPVRPIRLSVTWQSIIGGMVISKAAETGHVADVAFRVQGVEPDNRHIDRRVTTDHEGNAVVWDLPLGRYRVTEENVPAHYVRPAPQYMTVTQDVLYETRLTFNNILRRGELTIRKLSERGDAYAEGIQFEIVGVDERNGDIVRTVTTGADGMAVVRDLPLGRYRITEETDLPYYQAQPPQYVMVTDEPSAISMVTFTNELIRGRVEGLKINSENHEPLEGAVIGLFASDETEFTEYTAIEAVTSAADGRFAFEDLPFEEFVVREIRPPEGFILSDETFPVTIRYHGQVVEIEIENEEEPEEPEVPKTGDDTRLPWGVLVLSAATLALAIGGVCLYGRKKNKKN